jgi:pimeloyl-ACP methyl ester carboxylesterase
MISAMEVQDVAANGIRIAYETFGKPDDPPLLLVAGLAVQMLVWPEEFCGQLADHGFYVIRADNRDAGLSTHLHDAPKVSRLDLLLRRNAPYEIADMAADTVGLIDALDLGPVHLVGASMGGFIAQTVALRHPDRIRSLTLMMTSTGSRRVGQPRRDVLLRLLRSPVSENREERIEAALTMQRTIGSPDYPIDEALIRDIAGRAFDRDTDPAGRRRQLAAAATQPDRTHDLASLRVPTLVLHGLVDPVIAVSGGLALATAIPGARFVGFSGMGHDLPRALWPQTTAEIAALAGQGMR